MPGTYLKNILNLARPRCRWRWPITWAMSGVTGPGTAAGTPATGPAAKTLRTDAGGVRIEGPRDRAGTFAPAVLYRAPLPRTKLEASVPDGLVAGLLDVDGCRIEVNQRRGTGGHNWGTEHADRWVWLHAAGFAAAPQAWLELALARIKVGPARSPWTAIGAASLGGELVPLGGLGQRSKVSAGPGRLTASIPAPAGRLDLTVSTADDHAVAVAYADPRGGTRLVRHAALATVKLSFRSRAHGELAMPGTCGAYEYGTSQHVPTITPRPLPDGQTPPKDSPGKARQHNTSRHDRMCRCIAAVDVYASGSADHHRSNSTLRAALRFGCTFTP
jgi:hypothetical protein